MNEHIETLLKQYDNLTEPLNKIHDFVLSFLREEICVKQKILLSVLEGRIKARDSLEGKLVLKGHKYKEITDITDLFGARIVTFYTDEVDIIASMIEKYFIIDYENSIDKRKIYEVDRFGYMSLHYICQIPKELYYDEKCPAINEIRFEIQMRTTLQHVWATIFHDTGYKSDIEVPKEYIRRLARLEGLLEIADDEFLTIRNQINEYRTKIRSLVSEGNFADISLNIDSYKDYLALDPYRDLIKRMASITHAEVEEVSYVKFYKAFVDIGIKTLSELEQMRIENSDDAYKLALLNLQGTDIDIVSSTIAVQFLLVIYMVKNNIDKAKFMEIIKLLHGSQGMESYVDKITEQAKKIIKI